MLRSLAVCGLLTVTLSLGFGEYDESAYESLLEEQGFSNKDIELFLQEYRDARLEYEEETEFVRWNVAKGYHDCEIFKKKQYGFYNNRLCIGCLKPKSLSEICEELECPPMEGIGITACGFEARRVLGAKWAVTPIDTTDKEKGQTEAYWRLFKYINKANEQGARIAKTAYLVNRWFFDDDFKIESAQMALYIPSALQGSPPRPTDDLVTVERWDDAITYNRVFGGDKFNNPGRTKTHFKFLRRALRQESIVWYRKMKMTFEYIKPGCGDQRNEVMLVDESSMQD